MKNDKFLSKLVVFHGWDGWSHNHRTFACGEVHAIPLGGLNNRRFVLEKRWQNVLAVTEETTTREWGGHENEELL